MNLIYSNHKMTLLMSYNIGFYSQVLHFENNGFEMFTYIAYWLFALHDKFLCGGITYTIVKCLFFLSQEIFFRNFIFSVQLKF